MFLDAISDSNPRVIGRNYTTVLWGFPENAWVSLNLGVEQTLGSVVTTSPVPVLDAVVVSAEIWANAARAAWFAAFNIYRFHSRRIMSWTWAVRNPMAYTECTLAPFLVKNEISLCVPRSPILFEGNQEDYGQTRSATVDTPEIYAWASSVTNSFRPELL